MTRQEQIALLVTVAALVISGVITVKFQGSGLTPKGGKATDSAKVVVNSALRQGQANLFQSGNYMGDWTSPSWKIADLHSDGSPVLRPNHPLFRRPKHIGENRHKVMTEGWGGWYYNPPSEVYF